MPPSIVWFRQDLRVEDHLALLAAVQKEGPIIPLYIWAPEEEADWAPGVVSRWWLYHSLAKLQENLEELGLRLILRHGPSLRALEEIIQETHADSVFWHRRYEPICIRRDAKVRAELHRQGIKVYSFNGSLLFEPWDIANKQHKPFQVFAPFWKQCLSKLPPPLPLAKPAHCKRIHFSIPSVSLAELDLLSTTSLDSDLKAMWQPGSQGAYQRFQYALEEVITHQERRDCLDMMGVSYLSPHVHYGEISPRWIWNKVQQQCEDSEGAQVFLRQLGWREFAYHLLYHFPQTPHVPLRSVLDHFPWKFDAQKLWAWQQGQTGYPLIDAGMRQLQRVGWMHNRARLVAASFLVKDLMIPWQEGARWFWETLVDADLANNTLGWQWVAGCGADAAPYFRIFNPIMQGEKFDTSGNYVRQWLPELASLPDVWLHKPWAAPREILEGARIRLGVDYPYPIVDHDQAHHEVLAAYVQHTA